MIRTLFNFIFLIGMTFVFVNCANRGNPSGGPKDEAPPIIVKAIPDNFSTNFKSNEIRVFFDEYIKIKDIQKQLIISPPLKYQPEIKPLGAASKYISIKIFDTLKPNTTHAFNFGNSIIDNNEGNPYPFYRFVFSTGAHIDSLRVTGQIVDALKKQPETFVNVALYEVDSTFTDSIIYKEPPRYITNTLDSLTTFSIENIKAGKYLLIALKDKNGDNKFQQKSDQIAFHKTFIQVPTDSTYTLKLFNEEIDFRPSRPKLVSGEKIAFGYEGDHQKMAIKIRSDVPDKFEYRITKDPKTDSLYYWYKPSLEVDSLVFQVSKGPFEKDFSARIRPQKRDSLIIKTAPSGSINFDEDFRVSGSTPFVHFDPSKINLIDKDSTRIEFSTAFDSLTNTYAFSFDKTEANSYNFQILPKAFKGFFGTENDTLNVGVKTKKSSAYTDLRVVLQNATFPLIIQLVDPNEDLKYQVYASTENSVDFYNVIPGKYSIRAILDTNGNGQYDSGNYLEKQQPERVVNFEIDEEIRADWDIVQTIIFK